ncbi:hypothetical protein ACFJGX_09810 [Hydrogenophaga sp. UC242_50]|uniref:hypothetical protein n=1 Tax=Hydrogenophaga sp. UC242_50 TaxID=3350169 RepID=UPI0036D3A3EF
MPISPSHPTHAGRLTGLVAALALSQAACGTAPTAPETVGNGTVTIQMTNPTVTVAHRAAPGDAGDGPTLATPHGAQR